VLENLGGVPAAADDAEHVPLAVVVTPPTRVLEGILIDWEAQGRCMLYLLGSFFLWAETPGPGPNLCLVRPPFCRGLIPGRLFDGRNIY